MTAELDPLRDDGLRYAMRLLEAGVSVELHQFAGAFHGFDLFPTTLSQRALDEQVAWVVARHQHHIVNHIVLRGTMNRLRTLLVVGGLVIALAVTYAVPALAQSSGDKPKATEVGVTAKEIHIAVVADVDNPFVPGLFQGIVDGVKAGAKYLNSKAGGGGVAGRKVVVDFIDSKLNANEARNGVITACEQDFGAGRTSALFLTNVDDAVNCIDQAGATTGLPDVAAIVTGVPESCSPVTYSINPPQLDCGTKDQHPQTYYGEPGRREVAARAAQERPPRLVPRRERHQGRAARRGPRSSTPRCKPASRPTRRSRCRAATRRAPTRRSSIR